MGGIVFFGAKDSIIGHVSQQDRDDHDVDGNASSSLFRPLLNDDALSLLPPSLGASVGGSVEIVAAAEGGSENGDSHHDRRQGSQEIPTIVIIVVPLVILLGVLFLAAVFVPRGKTQP